MSGKRGLFCVQPHRNKSQEWAISCRLRCDRTLVPDLLLPWPVLVLTDSAQVENRGNTWVTNAGRRSGFAQKAKSRRFIAEIAVPDDFQSHEAAQIDVERLVSNAHCATTQLDRFPVFARHQFIMLKSPVCLSWCRLECVPRRRHAGLNPIQAIVYLYQCLLFEAPPIYNSPRCHLGLLRQALRPSKGSIWLSSTLTHTCLGGLPPKLTCSGTSASARLRFTKWCSPSNERANSSTARSRSQH